MTYAPAGPDYHNLQFYRYTPADLSVEELMCLEAAVAQTTKNGLMFSLESGERVLDGVVSTMPGADKILATLTEADYLLCHLSYGINHSKRMKTVSPVQTYANPLDVRCRLLTSAATDDNQYSQKAYTIYSKFHTVTPYPTFQMNPSAKVVLSKAGGNITVSEPLLVIGMRGIYHDWLGNVYYDDKAECCLEQEPFLQDFAKHYTEYIRHYPILARLEQYATVIGLLLSKPGISLTTRIETFRRYNAIPPSSNETSPEITAAKRRANAALEALIEFEPDPLTRLYKALYIAHTWFDLEDFLRAKDGALLVLLYAESMPDYTSNVLIKQLCSEALLLLARVMNIAVGGDKTAALINLPTDEVSELQNLLLPTGYDLQTATIPQVPFHINRCINRAIDGSLQLAIKAEDWATAYAVARFAATYWSNNLDPVSEQTVVANTWTMWKASIGLNLNRTSSLLHFINLLWPHAVSDTSSEVECTDPAILTKFLRWLDSEMVGDSEAVTQLSGFIFFVDAGMQLETNDNDDRKQGYSALASCLSALRCFTGCFDSKAPTGVSWKLMAAASALRLANVSKRLFLDAENHERSESIDQAVKELEALKRSPSSGNVDKILRPFHRIRNEAKQMRVGHALIAADKLIIDTYSTVGDKAKVALWQRTLETDSIEYGKTTR